MHWKVAGLYNRDRQVCLETVCRVLIEPLGYRQIKSRTGLHPHQIAAALARLLKSRTVVSPEPQKYRKR